MTESYNRSIIMVTNDAAGRTRWSRIGKTTGRTTLACSSNQQDGAETDGRGHPDLAQARLGQRASAKLANGWLARNRQSK